MNEIKNKPVSMVICSGATLAVALALISADFRFQFPSSHYGLSEKKRNAISCEPGNVDNVKRFRDNLSTNLIATAPGDAENKESGNSCSHQLVRSDLCRNRRLKQGQEDEYGFT